MGVGFLDEFPLLERDIRIAVHLQIDVHRRRRHRHFHAGSDFTGGVAVMGEGLAAVWRFCVDFV